ncbi:MAG: PorT family protein [Muribaculaceae bacterium]|nr:PorT family protein [Muribaculaceae bacterium]
MKSKLLIGMLLLAAATPGASAQLNPTFGVRASMEISLPSGAYDDYKVGAGFNVGAVCRLNLPRGFYFEPGAYFTYSAMTAKDLVSFDELYFYEGAANLYGIRVPLNVGYTYSVSPAVDLDFYTGPWLNINVSARQRLDPNFDAPEVVPARTINLFKHGWRHVDGQWGFGLTATFAHSYTVGITAGVAFTPLAKYGNGDKKVRIHRSTIALSLGYNF